MVTKIDSFTGEYRFLSNFYPHIIQYASMTFPYNEHAYQAMKTLDLAQRTLFQIQALLPVVLDANGKNVGPKEMTCGQAKRAGQCLMLRPDWEQIKVVIMTDLCKYKFQDPYLRKLLLKTGDAELIEGNWWNDTFWGVCNGVGQNQLGRILMAIRELYRRLGEE